jgi:hypothetical protein
LIIDIIGTNPREIKRFINKFIMTSNIYSSNQIDLDALLIKQALITRWPELAFLLSSNKEFLEIVEKYTELDSDNRLETFKNQKDVLPEEYSGVLGRYIMDNALWTILKQYHSTIFHDEKWLVF